MGKITLTEIEKKRLIDQYKSELRQLLYQVEHVHGQILELESDLDDTSIPDLNLSQMAESAIVSEDRPSSAKKAESTAKKRTSSKAKSTSTKKRGPGRPRKNPPKVKTKKSNKSRTGPGRPPKGSHTFEYTTQNGEKHELGPWDELVIKSIHQARQPLINSELLDIAMNTTIGQKQGKEKSRLMINRTIHKLVNRKPILKKAEYDGRGNAYATEGMLDEKGKIKSGFKRK
jgi:hypothetical protein